MVKQPPPAFKLDDAVMRRPAQHGLENAAGVRERAQRAVSDRIDQIVRVAGRVAEVVLAVVLVHPGGLEEAAGVVIGGDGRARLGSADLKPLHGRAEGVHVRAEFGDAWEEGDGVGARGLLRAGHGCVEGRARHVPALQLPAPQAAEVQVRLAVRVDEAGRVDRVAAGDVGLVGREGPRGRGRLGHADAEDPLLVARREVQVVFPVRGRGVGRPQLLRHPRHGAGGEGHAVVGHGPAGRGERQDVVVGHVILVAVVVEFDVGFAVLDNMSGDSSG